MKKDVWVYADWAFLEEPKKVGLLTSETIRKHEVFHFEYHQQWLSAKHSLAIDPKLNLFKGKQFTQQQGNFGIFLDSCPDRWGRLLMARREAVQAKLENRLTKQLNEIDYLLGVHDQSRIGALRFKQEEAGDFLNNEKQYAAPPFTSLQELSHAVQVIENDDVFDKDYLKWLSVLIAPGSSLGGARPKASVLDGQSHLWIAKFPSKQDNEDIGAWEYLLYLLARDAGIEMAECEIKKINSNYHTFLTKRFDRTNEGKRKHFCSAMTLLGYRDGDEGASYLELANFLFEQGSNSKKDLEQLFRRVVFNIAVSNCDDHLRNHGFIFENKGWRLSPAYDLNPISPNNGLHLNVDESNNNLDFELALSTAQFYRLAPKEADKLVEEVKRTVGKWKVYAKQAGLSRAEQERKASAFHE